MVKYPQMKFAVLIQISFLSVSALMAVGRALGVGEQLFRGVCG